ncbi:MAG: hypothetical protein HQK53_00850 [Oligoflexia bacterium]|nr:hypothetical protein [Oligoflexia bacterium]
MFVSYAKNCAHTDRDIDIALVSPDFEYIAYDILLKILLKIARHIDTAIEPVALTEDEINNPQLGSVAVDIAKEGRRLFTL